MKSWRQRSCTNPCNRSCFHSNGGCGCPSQKPAKTDKRWLKMKLINVLSQTKVVLKMAGLGFVFGDLKLCSKWQVLTGMQYCNNLSHPLDSSHFLMTQLESQWVNDSTRVPHWDWTWVKCNKTWVLIKKIASLVWCRPTLEINTNTRTLTGSLSINNIVCLFHWMAMS